MRLTQLDLFTGLGAFSLGFERQGFTPIQQVEIDENCLKLLATKWPTVPRQNNVEMFDPDTLAECPTVVTFGSPCQDLSVAGQRAGMAGERSGLFYHATRIIRRLVGRGLEFALWENVEGAFSSNGGRDFAGVLAELAECGALDIGWRLLDCQYFGLAQRRRRVFLVADFRGRRAAQILSFSEGLQGHPAPRREAGQKVAPCIGGVSNGGGANGPGRDVDSCESLVEVGDCARRLRAQSQSSHREDSETFIPVVARAVTAECDGYNDGSDQTYICMAHGQSNAEQVSDGEPSLTCNHEAPILIPIQSVNMVRERKQNGIGIGKDGDPSFTLTGRDQHAICFQSRIARNGRGQPEEICPALRGAEEGDTADSKPLIAFDTTQITSPGNYSNPKPGEPCHPLASKGHDPAISFSSKMGGNDGGIYSDGSTSTVAPNRVPATTGNFGVRRLTPTECERLMGLPDGWTAGFSDSVRYRMIGNSAAVPVIEWLAKAMREALTKATP